MAVTGTGATDAVIGGVIVIAGSAVVKDTIKGHFTMRPIVAGFLLGSALLLVAAASPALAKGLTILGVIGALIENGPTVFGALGSGVKSA